jgi:hypothetical protein
MNVHGYNGQMSMGLILKEYNFNLIDPFSHIMHIEEIHLVLSN